MDMQGRNFSSVGSLHFSQKIVFFSLQLLSVTSQLSPAVSATPHTPHPHNGLYPLRLGAQTSPPPRQLLLVRYVVTEMRKINNTMACCGVESGTSPARSQVISGHYTGEEVVALYCILTRLLLDCYLARWPALSLLSVPCTEPYGLTWATCL